MLNKIFLRAYCSNNLGDDLFIRLICQRYPDITFYIIADKGTETGLKDITNLHIVKRNVIIRTLNKVGHLLFKNQLVIKYLAEKCDAIVLLGGSLFIEGGHAWEEALIEQKKLLKYSEQVTIMGANFGPFHTERFYELYYDFFSRLEDVCFRDRWSYEQFSELKQVRYAPDLVLTLDTSRFVRKKEKRMTVIPILLENRPDLRQYETQYTECMVSLIKQAVESGWEVVLQSFCKDQGDEIEINRILDNLDIEFQSKVRCSFYSANMDEMLDVIAGSEIVVSTRFHGMILGWMFNAKVYPVVYSNKMKNYLEDIHYKGSYSTVEDLQLITLEDVVNERNQVDVTELMEAAGNQYQWIDKHNMSKK